MSPQPPLLLDSPFLLDSNVFIEAAKRYYAFDIAPTFWEQLVHHASEGRILSIDRVRDELAKQQDELSKWANEEFRKYFASTNGQEVREAYGEIMNWVDAQSQFTKDAKDDFARIENADAWLVAYAKAKGYVVVTHEQYNSDAKRRIPIPNVCKAFGVPYVNTFEMLRQLKIKVKVSF